MISFMRSGKREQLHFLIAQKVQDNSPSYRKAEEWTDYLKEPWSLDKCEHPLTRHNQSRIWIYPWPGTSTTQLQSTELLEFLYHFSDQNAATSLWLFSEHIKSFAIALQTPCRNIPVGSAAKEQESSASWDSPMWGLASCCWDAEPWPGLFPFRLWVRWGRCHY